MKKVKSWVTLAVFFMLAVLAAGVLSPSANFVASAAESTYSSVLADLKKDPAFSESDYPAKAKDYSLQVIQIAESTNSELFVYVYQPSAGTKQLTAASINISRSEGETQSFRNYKLKLLDRSGRFGKYLVEGFGVQASAETRIYNIPSIFRAWDSDIDKDASGGNTGSEVPCEVAKCFAATDDGDEVIYECRAIETITVTDKYCGHLKYDRGDVLFGSVLDVDTDSYYVAFTTDRPIDTLLEADVYYLKQDVLETTLYSTGFPSFVIGTETEYIDPEPVPAHVELLSTTDVEVSGVGYLLNFHKYEWKEIESVTDFKKNNNLTQNALDNLFGKKWVLRFGNFDRIYLNMGIGKTLKRTEVSDVTILRLKFETAGKTYNLGVVDNKQSPDPDAPPDNKPSDPSIDPEIGSLWDWIKQFFKSIGKFFTGGSDWWIYVIVAVVALILLPTILGVLIPSFGKLFVMLFKGLLWLICLPFKGIAALVRAISNRRKKGNGKE